MNIDILGNSGRSNRSNLILSLLDFIPTADPIIGGSLNAHRPQFSVCIPAYNRASHLAPLLDSIFSQNYHDFEVVICEDNSPQRVQIAGVVREYQSTYPDIILRYIENETNLGYDGNIRRLVEMSNGQFCFFMGNDDLMCADALAHVSGVIGAHSNVGVVLKSYAWFDESPGKINQEVRYFNEETDLGSGPGAIGYAFRRSGVISGYIVHRDAAHDAATDEFDGTLYYQMHLTARVLLNKTAVCTPQVLVLCRNSEPPDFGASARERGKYLPGRYTPTARVNMIAGAISIIRNLQTNYGVDVVEKVIHDYANYFYPYIKDQLTLSLREYWKLYREFAGMGFGKYPLFHLYFIAGYLLGEEKFDAITRVVRRRLGRSPHL
jgi:abequosyltransferase